MAITTNLIANVSNTIFNLSTMINSIVIYIRLDSIKDGKFEANIALSICILVFGFCGLLFNIILNVWRYAYTGVTYQAVANGPQLKILDIEQLLSKYRQEGKLCNIAIILTLIILVSFFSLTIGMLNTAQTLLLPKEISVPGNSTAT